MINMEDIFAKASLCYLTNRSDEGFQLIFSFITTLNKPIDVNSEQQQVFCLISMNIIEKRYKSWINLNRCLIKTDNLEQRQSIETYTDIIRNELDTYSKEILLLIEKYLFKSSFSSETKIFYLKMQGDIHFLLSQISIAENRSEHMHLSLQFYNQTLEMCSQMSYNNNMFLPIIYNKALLFVILKEDYDQAKTILKNALVYADEQDIQNDNELNKIKSLLKYLEEL